MRQEKNKKLKWNKPYLASFGSIVELSMGECSSGSGNSLCATGNLAIDSCGVGNDAANSCADGGTPILQCNNGSNK